MKGKENLRPLLQEKKHPMVCINRLLEAGMPTMPLTSIVACSRVAEEQGHVSHLDLLSKLGCCSPLESSSLRVHTHVQQHAQNGDVSKLRCDVDGVDALHAKGGRCDLRLFAQLTRTVRICEAMPLQKALQNPLLRPMCPVFIIWDHLGLTEARSYVEKQPAWCTLRSVCSGQLAVPVFYNLMYLDRACGGKTSQPIFVGLLKSCLKLCLLGHL